jgi:FAD synthase
MNGAIQKAFEAVLMAQKKLADARTDLEFESAEKELKQATNKLITIEARIELLNKVGANQLVVANFSEEEIEKFLEILLQ